VVVEVAVGVKEDNLQYVFYFGIGKWGDEEMRMKKRKRVGIEKRSFSKQIKTKKNVPMMSRDCG